MPERLVEILLVEGDPELCEMIVHQLEAALGCHVTVANTASEALREELTTRHDLVITSADLEDDDGLAFLRELRATNDCPVLVTANESRPELVIEALRRGAVEWFEKPFDLAAMIDIVREVLEDDSRRRREQARYRRLRKVVHRIIREREDLSERMDLLCRDLVQAYRRLAEKVTDSGVLTNQES